MQETTSLWECSSTLERKTPPQTFICRACFPSPSPPPFFPYLLLISLQLEAFARSTQSLEKRLLGRAVRLQEVIARSQTEKKEQWLVQIRVVCKGAPAQRERALGQLELATSRPRVACQAEGLTGVRTLDPTACSTGGKKGHFHNLYLVCLVLFFLM